MKTIDIALCGFLLGTVALTNFAGAATVTYGLAGDTSSLATFNGIANNGIPFVASVLFLTDATTGSQQLPDSVLSIGDTIDGHVTLTSPVNVPANVLGGANGTSTISVSLQQTENSSTVLLSEFLKFYSNGIELPPISGFNTSGGSGGALNLAIYALNTDTPSFTFDEIVFGGTVTNILDSNQQSISTTNLFSITSSPPALYVTTFAAPVPVPPSFWLMFLALSVLASGFLRKKAQSNNDYSRPLAVIS